MQKLFVVSLIAIIPFIIGAKTAEAATTYAPERPALIMAPSISLFSPIEDMGINSKGELDVPDGETNTVGWYAGGVLPGGEGTAVLDAHVYAAFKNLSKVKPGESIYIWMTSGRMLRFVVRESRLYSLSTLSPLTLFEPANTTKKINLITCAGNWSSKAATYTHRLIVSAELV